MPVQSAHSAIHACRLADGTVTFQDTECPVIPVAKTKSTAKSKKKTIPFGIEKTWFDAPPVIPDRAICTKNECHCDMFTRKFKGGLPIAIADALYLDGSWHRLESTNILLADLSLNSGQQAELNKERDEAACNILMSQKILQLFGAEVLRELRNKKRYAEDRGLDNPEDCDAGDLLVCEHIDLIDIYQRIQSDIKALSSRSRIESDESNDVLATSDND